MLNENLLYIRNQIQLTSDYKYDLAFQMQTAKPKINLTVMNPIHSKAPTLWIIIHKISEWQIIIW